MSHTVKFNDAGALASCRGETCHNDGHWTEVAFPDAGTIEDCLNSCHLHPEATGMQFNDDGWCGCLALTEGVTFRDAINGPHIHGEVTACTVCDLTSVCHEDTCHNDGHWQEVAFPEVSELLGCQQQCILHPEATAFQFNPPVEPCGDACEEPCADQDSEVVD